jgi:outer membrane lipoprotein SlyB
MKTLARRMKHPLIAAMLGASALAITAGCESFAPQDYGYGEARTAESVAYGTVESVRPARLNEDHAPVGTIAGTAIGGLLGNTIGHGDGRGIATILGAVGGGFAGNAIEHNASAQNGEEIVVHLDNGSTIAVVQGAQGFERGQRVRVLSGTRGSRVEHA